MERYDDIDASAEFDQLVSCDSLTLVGHDDGDAQQTCTPSSYHHRRRRKQKQKQKERERERDGTEGTGTGKDKSRGEGGRRSGKLGNEVIKNFNSNGNSTFVIRGSSRRSSGSHGGESGSGSRDEVVVFQNDGSSRNRNRIRNVTATSTATDDANTNDKTTTGSSTSGPSNNNNNNTNYSDNNMEVTSPHTKKDRLYHHAKTFSTSTLSLNSTFHSTSSSASHSRSHSHSHSRSHSHSQYNHPSRTRPRPQSYDFLDPEPDSTFTGGGPLSPTGSVTNSVIFNVPFELKPSCDPKSVTISSNNNHEADCSDNSRSSSRSVVDTWSENNEEDEEERMKGLQDMIKTMEGNVLQLRKDEGDIETVLETMTSRLGALEIILDSVCHDNTNGQDKMQMVSNGTTSTSAGVLKLSKKSAGLHRRYLQLAMNRRRTELTVTIRAKYNAMTVVSDKQKELYRLQMSR